MSQVRLSHQPGDFLDPERQHYRVLSRIDQGGMGTVYKVVKEPTQTEYAVKECDLLDDPRRHGMPRAEAVRIFISEASSIEQLKIEGVPQGFLLVEPQRDLTICLSCGNAVVEVICPMCKPTADSLFAKPQKVANRYYLVMDYIEGQDAGQQVSQWSRPLPGGRVREIGEWLTAAAGILAQLHQRHLIHRDIKPANLRIRAGDNRLFLLDFGLLRLESDSSKTKVLRPKTTYNLGTEGFAAPEQRQGEPCPASDIFALGMTAIGLLTGLDPANPLERKHIETTAVASLLPQLSPAIRDLLHLSLSPDPALRPSATEWVHAWQADVVFTVPAPATTAPMPTRQPGSDGQSNSSRSVAANAGREWWRDRKIWVVLALVILTVSWFVLRDPIADDVMQARALSNSMLFAQPSDEHFLERLKGGETMLVKDAQSSSQEYWLRVYTLNGERRKAYIRRAHVQIMRKGNRP